MEERERDAVVGISRSPQRKWLRLGDKTANYMVSWALVGGAVTGRRRQGRNRSDSRSSLSLPGSASVALAGHKHP